MLVPISRTSHRLREVTLADPMLWTHGYAMGRESTFAYFLSRSQGVPLTVLLTEKTWDLCARSFGRFDKRTSFDSRGQCWDI
ncbi:hypothetical protein C8Q74DRAFT_147388 [Fomes fomentarius]|nr:hypothetical protein C8Q74DRAFT_147388 [Fomes fomentarius]